MVRRKNKTKWAYWLIVLALFIVAGAVAYLVWNSYFRNKGEEVHTDNTTKVAENKKTNDLADIIFKNLCYSSFFTFVIASDN